VSRRTAVFDRTERVGISMYCAVDLALFGVGWALTREDGGRLFLLAAIVMAVMGLSILLEYRARVRDN
jgi:hypothetical protein